MNKLILGFMFLCVSVCSMAADWRNCSIDTKKCTEYKINWAEEVIEISTSEFNGYSIRYIPTEKIKVDFKNNDRWYEFNKNEELEEVDGFEFTEIKEPIESERSDTFTSSIICTFGNINSNKETKEQIVPEALVSNVLVSNYAYKFANGKIKYWHKYPDGSIKQCVMPKDSLLFIVRYAADVIIYNKDKAYLIDWKTGEYKGEVK